MLITIQLITPTDLAINNATGKMAVLDQNGGIIADNIDPSESYFTAIGYEPYLNLTKPIPRAQLLTIADLNDLSWTAPKNIPVGSLTHRLLSFYYKSEYYDNLYQCYEMQYYVGQSTPLELQRRLGSQNILVNGKFFDSLEKRISTLSNTVNRESELELYLETFKEQNPSPREVAQFKLTVSAMQKEAEERDLLLQKSTPHPITVRNKR